MCAGGQSMFDTGDIQPSRVVASRDSLTLGLSPEAIGILALRAFERMRFEPEKNNRVKWNDVD